MNAPYYENCRSVRYRFRKFMSKLTLGRVDSPFLMRLKAHYEPLDAEANSKSTPDPSEKIDTIAIWAFEMFTPTNVASLERSVRAFELGRDVGNASAKSVSGWLRETRTQGIGGWMNLGRLKWPRDVTANFALPEFAAEVDASLYAVTPSITCLALCFTATAKEKREIEGAMRVEDKTTFAANEGGGFTIIDPSAQKRRRIEGVTRQRHEQIRKWIVAHFPGVFTRDGGFPPTCDFNVYSGFSPFGSPEAHRSVIPSHLDLMRCRPLLEDRSCPNVYLGWDALSGESVQRHMILAARSEAEGAAELFGRSDDEGLLYWAILNYTPALVYLNCGSLLDYYRNKFCISRDKRWSWFGSRGNSLKYIDDLAFQTSDSIDVYSVCMELERLGKSGVISSPWSADFRITSGTCEELSAFVNRYLMQGADDLRNLYEGVNRHILQQGNLLSARENIRLQRVVLAVAVASAVIAVWGGWR